MNNYEEVCLAFLNDVLTNRPKDLNGQVILFDDESRKKYLEAFKHQYSIVEQDKAVDSKCRELLKRCMALCMRY